MNQTTVFIKFVSASTVLNFWVWLFSFFGNVEQIDLNFYANDGTELVDTISIPKKSKIEFPENTLIRDGYDFVSWNDKKDGSGNYFSPNMEYKVTEEAIFYAIWSPKTYTISYELNGGINREENPSNYIVGEGVNLLNPTKTGYNFSGWFENAEFEGKPISQIENFVVGNLTLHAGWYPKRYLINYELENGINNENNPNLYTIEQNVKLFNPTKEGYTFIGWYNNKNLEGTATTSIPRGSIGSKTFYACWKSITYNISYELNGGVNSEDNPTSYTIESSFNLLNPTKDGYSFIGWFENAEFEGESVSFIAENSTEDKTFYASFIEIEPDEPVEIEPEIVEAEEQIIEIEEPEQPEEPKEELEKEDETEIKVEEIEVVEEPVEEEEPEKTKKLSQIKVGAYFNNQYALGDFREMVFCSIGGGVVGEFSIPLPILNLFGIAVRLQGDALLPNMDSIEKLINFSFFAGPWINIPIVKNFSINCEVDYGFVLNYLKTKNEYEKIEGLFVDQAMQFLIDFRYSLDETELIFNFAPVYTLYLEKETALNQLGFNAGIIYKIK